MRELKRVNQDVYIENLFRNLAKQKEISVTVCYGDMRTEAKMSFNARRGNEPTLKFEKDVTDFKADNVVEIHFIHNDVFFLFRSGITSIIGDTCQLEKPAEVFSALQNETVHPALKPLSTPISGKPILSSGLAYHQNGKPIAYGSVIRIYDGTFLGQHVISVPNTKMNQEANVSVYSGLADYMLSHPNFEYYINYVNTELDWHREVFLNMGEIINDSTMFSYDTLQYFECNMKTLDDGLMGADSDAYETGGFLCESMDHPDEFIEYCKASLNLLEVESYSYNETRFNLGEIGQVYSAMELNMSRRLWRISKDGSVCAYAVAEAYPDEFAAINLVDNCRLFVSDDSADIEQVLQALMPEMLRFYGKNSKRSFNILLEARAKMVGDMRLPGLKYKSEVGRVIMSRSGLVEYKKLLMDNFLQLNRYYPLTHPQMGIWYTEKVYPGTSFGNIVSSIWLEDDIDYALLETAIRYAVEKNDGIRLRMVEMDGVPCQYVARYQHFKIDYFDFSQQDEASGFVKWNESMSLMPFKIIDSVLFYFALIKTKENGGGFYIKIHHLISDAWSIVSLINSIVEYYSMLKKGMEVSKSRKPSYIDFILSEQAFIHSDTFLKQKRYWDAKFETMPEFTSLKPSNGGYKSTKAERKSYTLSKELTARIHQFCEAEKVSPFAVFLSILYIYLNRITAKEDIVLGTPILNRSHAREKEMAGMFISMAPLRMKVDPSLSFNDFTAYISKELMVALRNQKYPYDRILKDFRERHKTKDSLFDVALSYQNATQMNDGFLNGYHIKWHHNGFQTDSLEMHINDRGNDGSYEIDLDYLISVFSEVEIGDIWMCLSRLLDDAVKNPLKRLFELELLSIEEKKRILYDFNDTKVDYSNDKIIQELIEMQVMRTPSNAAVVLGDTRLTYKELNSKANYIAWLLRRNGVKPESIVGIMMEPSLEMFIGILGILKAGGAYLPIDPDYPLERIEYILDDSGVKILLTDSNSLKSPINNKTIYMVDKYTFEGDDWGNPENINSPDDLSYVIYTSGSTGRPKGVMIEHKSLLNLCFWHVKHFGITENDRSTKYAGVGFDASVWEIFPYLISGATIYIVDKRIRYDINKLNDFFHENSITISFLPTQVCEGFMELDNKSLRFLLTGADKLKRYIGKRYQLVNNYGPTESTVVTTCFSVNCSYPNIPIGKPIFNTRVYILSKNNTIQPIGIVGELCIAGDGLARGYLNRKELEEGRFIDGSFVDERVLYRTGDIARWLPDGNIEFLGRIDDQVKIRGYRIEIGEIEACLLELQSIKQAAVTIDEDNSGNKFLCAYYVSDTKFYTEQIKGELANRLPDYMLPLHFVHITEMPLTANGKVDKAKLPKVKTDDFTVELADEPKNDIEKAIIQAAEALLHIKHIGTNQNLISLGCDSLMLVRLIADLHEKYINVSMQDLYDCATIKHLAERVQDLNESNSYCDHDSSIRNIQIEDCDFKMSRDKEKLNNILLTGATGYLGIHLLRYLLQNTDSYVTCMVRGDDIKHSQKRLFDTINFYYPNKYTCLPTDRLKVINGDLSKERLGLDETEYNGLGRSLNAILNPAAIVKHYGNYDEFVKVNINGVKRLIELAGRFDLRLNHISTVSISGNYVWQRKNNMFFSEKDFFIDQDISDNPYVRSKFEAEKLVLKAMKDGVACSILRVGNLTGRYNDGQFQRNVKDNRFYNMLRTIIMTGTIPRSMLEEELDLTPIDLCSCAVMLIASNEDTRYHAYHLYNSKMISVKSLLSFLSELGYKITGLDDQIFMDNLSHFSKKYDDFEVFKGFIGALDSKSRKGTGYKVIVSSDITDKRLAEEGFIWPEIDLGYIKRIISHIASIRFI